MQPREPPHPSTSVWALEMLEERLFTSSRAKIDTSDSEADEERENLSGVPWEVWVCPFVCLFQGLAVTRS